MIVAQLAATAILLACAASLRPKFDVGSVQTGRPAAMFWKDKILRTTPARIVLAGDSRGFRGLAPERIADAMSVPVDGVLNFCFSGVAFDDSYLRRVDELIDRADAPSCVLLTLTPGAFTPDSLKRNGFLQREEDYGAARHSAFARLKHAVESPLDDLAQSRWLRPLDDRILRTWSRGARPGRRSRLTYAQDFTRTGWVASSAEPPDLDFYIEHFETKFTENTVDSAAIERLLDQVRAWTVNGTTVFALRMPISAGLRAQEDRHSGMDWETFIPRFTQAGGAWIDVDHSMYTTYDGSHLPADEARRFSTDIGTRMQEVVTTSTTTSTN
jgi:hypothetical protein